jgi:hypothetical protein
VAKLLILLWCAAFEHARPWPLFFHLVHFVSQSSSVPGFVVAQIEFSPFIENRVAVATAQNFGIIGNGRQYVLEVSSPLGPRLE